jgi:hypothetical protein
MKKVSKAEQAKRKKVTEKRAAYTKARIAKKYLPRPDALRPESNVPTNKKLA